MMYKKFGCVEEYMENFFEFLSKSFKINKIENQVFYILIVQI